MTFFVVIIPLTQVSAVALISLSDTIVRLYLLKSPWLAGTCSFDQFFSAVFREVMPP